MQLKITFRQILCIAMVLGFGTQLLAQISIPNASFTNAQDFNTLANTGTSSAVPTGWAFIETGANANGLYAAGTGSSNAGDTYSFGLVAPSTERALGGLRSGNLVPNFGVCYTNNTGGTITSFTVAYTGEQWRFGTLGRNDRLEFQYNQSTTAINGAGTWTTVPALEYLAPQQATVGINPAGGPWNSTVLSSTITGLNIAAGATFCFRWNDIDATSSDDGLGVDDYSLTNITVAPPCEVIGYSFNNISACNDNGTPGNSADDYFTTDVSVLYSNSTNGDSLILTGGDLIFRTTRIALVGTNVTSTFTFVRFRADGSAVDFTGQIGMASNIRCSLPGTGPAVNSCSSGAPVPANNECANATPIDCGGSASGTTTTATIDGPALDCNGGSVAADVWYTIVGTGTAITASLCGGGTNYDSQLDVYTGSCGALVNIGGCNDDFCGAASEMTWNSTAGTLYRIRVHGFGGSTGNYSLDVSCAAVPPNGAATVACPSLAVPPIPPVVLDSECGDTITPTVVIIDVPNPLICEGTRTYDYTYTGCAGVEGMWSFTYTVERNPFSGPNDSSIIVSCLSQATQLTPPTVMSNCGEVLTPTGPVVTDNPNPLTCEGTRTYTFTYTDCEGNQDTWSTIYTIERLPFTVPNNGFATVACPALAVAPTLPTVTSNCGEVLTPTGPVITNVPDPLTCEGTRTYAYTYTDCEGNTATWSFVYTVERNPFTVPNNGFATVACPALAVAPTLPTVTSNCGEVLTPTGPVITNVPDPLTCEGTRTYAYTYTDCEGNTATWSFVYTVERLPFTVPANGAATVACPALATQPVPPVVLSNCGEILTPAPPVITNNPNPLTCEGTRTYAFSYTDCEGNIATWSFVYTIERLPFTVPANGAATVNCPANATQPIPPVVLSNCGETLTPTGPVVTNNPNPLTCEGTRTYAWTYTDCEGNTATWSFVYTIERQPFTIATPNGGTTVACPDQTDVVPTPPVVLSNCGEVLTPVITSTPKNACEGDRVYYFTYTDCEGNTATWQFNYHTEYLDFLVPASEVVSVQCPINALLPTPPIVFDNCGRLLNPAGPFPASSTNASGCEGSRSYTWTYTDCEGNTHNWSKTYLFLYSADFFAPADEVNIVSCLAYAVAPFPQVLFDNCGQQIQVSNPVMTQSISSNGCTGTRTYSYVYRDCGGHARPWKFTYIIEDNQAPVGNCEGGNSPISVDVRNLQCIEDVPCPDDYDFDAKVEELLEAGNYFDVCFGDQLFVTLDSYTDLWECSDPDGDGDFTFGRTFYFRIADRCGNAYPSLCEVTYSGACQPLATFSMADWGIEGGAPGNTVPAATSDLSVIMTLLNSGPVLIGGSNRSITLTDAQCVMNMMPGTGGPSVLANCQQTNCTGCNPMGVGGLKNALAANAIALELNIRYNQQYNGLTRTNIRNQDLGCIDLHPCIVYCPIGGVCRLHFFDAAGVEHFAPFTIGGLQDLVNTYLNYAQTLTIGQRVIYGTALNQSLLSLNSYFGDQTAIACDNVVPDFSEIEKLINEYGLDFANGAGVAEKPNFEIVPNPASHDFNFKLSDVAEGQEISLEIINALGQKVMMRKYDALGYVNDRIDISGLGNGLYFVNVKVGENRFEQKLVISKD